MGDTLGPRDEGILILQACDCVPSQDVGVLGDGNVDIRHVIGITAHLGEGCEHLADAVDELAPPGAFRDHAIGIGSLRAREAESIGIEAQLAADDRRVHDIVVIDARVRPGLRLAVVEGEQPAEVVHVGAEVIAVALSLQVHLGDAVRAQDVVQLVEAAEGVVALHGRIPAELPPAAQVEQTLRVDAAAELVAQQGLALGIGERGLVDAVGIDGLVDARHLDRVRAILEAVPELALEQHIGVERRLGDRLAGPLAVGLVPRAIRIEDERAEGEIHIRGDVPEIGDFGRIAEIAGVPEGGGKEARAALHGRVGRIEVRRVEHREAQEVQIGILEVEVLLRGDLRDLVGADAPDGRRIGIVRAGFAGGVDALVEHRDVAALAHGALGSDAGLLLGHHFERSDEAVAEVIGQHDAVGVDDGAVGVLDADVALCRERVGIAVVDDLVGQQRVVVVVDLDIALGDDTVAAVLGNEVVSLQQQGLVVFRLNGLLEDAGILRIGGGGLGRLRMRRGAAKGSDRGHQSEGASCRRKGTPGGNTPPSPQCAQRCQAPPKHYPSS